MKTIPFDIEKAKDGAKVVTRDGREVRIVFFDAPNKEKAFCCQFCAVDNCESRNAEFDAEAFISSTAIPEPRKRDKIDEWLNSRHFDYHGLIDKGLALEAPERLYDIIS